MSWKGKRHRPSGALRRKQTQNAAVTRKETTTYIELPCMNCGKVRRWSPKVQYRRCLRMCEPYEGWKRLAALAYEQRTATAQRLNREGAAHRRAVVRQRRARAITPLSPAAWKYLDVTELNDELRELLYEQQRDDRARQWQYGASLDAVLDDERDTNYSSSRFGSVHFDREDDEWAYYAAMSRHLSPLYRRRIRIVR